MQEIRRLGSSLSTLEGLTEAVRTLVAGAQEATDAQVTDVMRVRLEMSLRLCFPQTAEEVESGDEVFGTESLEHDVEEAFETRHKIATPGRSVYPQVDSQNEEPNPMLDELEDLITDSQGATVATKEKGYPTTHPSIPPGDAVGHSMPKQQSTSAIGYQPTSGTPVSRGSFLIQQNLLLPE